MQPEADTTAKLPLRTILRLIPRQSRRGAAGVILATVALALLDFAGVAALVPLLLVVLDETAALRTPGLGWFYQAAHFDSFGHFVVAICLLVIAFIVVKSLLTVLISDRVYRYLMGLYRYYSTRMFDTYLSRGLLFIRGHHTSALINDINGICIRFTDGVLGLLLNMATEVILLLLIAATLLWYDPRLVLLAAVVFLPLSLLYTLVFRRRMNRNGREENRLFVAQNKTLYETLRGYADIEINNAERYVSDRFRDGLDRLTSCRRQAMLIRTAAGRMSELSLILGVAVMIVIGLATGEEMASLKIALGVFAVAAYKIIPSVNRLINSWIEYRRNLFAAEKIADTLGHTDTVRFTPPTHERLPFRTAIDFEHVTFRYEPEGRAVLNDFSLHIAKGERIGIRGRSGAGKSTLLNILCGFFTPNAGRLTIDGVPLTPDNRRAWQNNIAYVSQEVFLPDIPLAENIAFGVPPEAIDPERLRRAIEAASLTELVDSLPEGTATVTGEVGCRLSGGQRQRVGIARALYKEASVLLFDEATSSLDSRTERDIVEAIEHLSTTRRELTLLIISHRERTLDFCDRIIEIAEPHE